MREVFDFLIESEAVEEFEKDWTDSREKLDKA